MKVVDWRGIRNLVAAKLLTDTAEAIEFDTPFPVCGTSKLSRSTETSSGKKYYDNSPAFSVISNGADEVAVDGSAIEDEVLAKLMGEFYDEETGLYIEGEPDPGEFAIGYITKKTDGTEILVWRLKGTFAYPDEEHNTEDDGTDSTGSSITYSGVATQHKFKKHGKKAKAVRIPLDKFPGGEAAFFAQVQTPDTITAAAAVTD